MNLLITGSTGYLGKNLVPLLSKSHEHLYLLVRKNSFIKAQNLFGHLDNITLVKGDLTNPDLVDDIEFKLQEKVESILHMGAYYDLQGEHKEAYLQNVMGTLNVTFFARLCKNLKSFHYVSTVAVSGEYKGLFKEEDFSLGQSFSNSYSETKYEAERIVRRLEGVTSVTIYRPGIIIGNSNTGEFDKVDGPYYFWKTISKVKSVIPGISNLPVVPLPIVDSSILPVVCVDHAAKLIEKGLTLKDAKEIRCFHLVDNGAPKVKDLIVLSLKKFKVNSKLMVISNHPLIEKAFDYLGLPKEIIHYMITPVKYDTKESEKKLLLSNYISFSEYSEVIIGHAIKYFKENK
jgi:thioester reductase-like protein